MGSSNLNGRSEASPHGMTRSGQCPETTKAPLTRDLVDSSTGLPPGFAKYDHHHEEVLCYPL